jgi:hypothetical protein
MEIFVLFGTADGFRESLTLGRGLRFSTRNKARQVSASCGEY